MTELHIGRDSFPCNKYRALHHLVYFGFDGGYVQEQSANDNVCMCLFGKASKDCSKLRLNKRPNNYRENRS